MHKKILVSVCGYQPDMKKTALCITNAVTFSVINEDNKKAVFSGVLSAPMDIEDIGETVRVADFSQFKESGRYYIKCGFRRSDTFVIADDICSALSELMISGIYLNRCGFDFESAPVSAELMPYEKFKHKACHTEMSPLLYGKEKRDVSGGWHCGGGYGKSVPVTAFACAYMLWTIRLFGGKNTERLTEECRWGIEWLLKMQTEDGGVYHKCDTLKDSSWPEPPADDKSEYFIYPQSSQATMIFTAVIALAASVYEKYDIPFSRKLSRAATNGWIWIVNSPDYEPWKMPAGTSYNGVLDIPDEDGKDDYLWVLSEMFSLTGDELFEKKFLDALYKNDISGFSINRTGGFAALSYLMNNLSHDPAASFYIKKKFGDRADKIIASRLFNSGGRNVHILPDSQYFEECSNMRILSDCIVCQTAYMIFGIEKYLRAAEDLLQYIIGKNPMGMSYITGSADSAPTRPLHSLSASGDFGSPIPGMLVSGPSRAEYDGYSVWLLRQDTPSLKRYIDSEYSRSNEPAVCFGAAALMVFSFFENGGSSVFDDAVNSGSF